MLCDVGVFFPADQEFAETLALREGWVPGADFPALGPGGYHCLISHGHTDHYAGLLAPGEELSAEVYAGDLTWRVLQRTSSQLVNRPGNRPDIRHAGTFIDAVPFQIGDCRVTPVRVRHNIPDSWAFVVDCHDSRLLYAPEFMNRFWESQPEVVRDVDVVVIGYMPDVAPGTACGFSAAGFPTGDGPDSLAFYVTPGENLESIESCFRTYDGPTFVSPYVGEILSIVPDHMLAGFGCTHDSAVLDGLSACPESGLVACNSAEMMGYLKANGLDGNMPWVVSNDFSLSTLAREIGNGARSGRQVELMRHLVREGRFVDAFESAHGSQELVRDMLEHLLRFRDRVAVMVTHATGHDSLAGAFGGRIEVLDELRI